MKGLVLKKENKGVTLIALAVMIVVIVILAGITIYTAVGDEGVLKKARETSNLVRNESAESSNMMFDFIEKISSKPEEEEGDKPEEINTSEEGDSKTKNHEPTIGEPVAKAVQSDYEPNGTNSDVTIEVTAEDEDGDALTFTLWLSESKNGPFEKKRRIYYNW